MAAAFNNISSLHAHALDSAPMVPSSSARSGMEMSWADPSGAFEHDNQFSDGPGAFGTQDCPNGEEDGYSDDYQ